MNKQIFKQYIGYAGQVGIVLVSLYLLFTVGMDFYLYDVEYSDGSDDARWTIPKESWDYENTIGLFWWGFYLLVTGFHLFLYFLRLSSKKKFNMWALPTFNIDGMRILSAILSLFFIIFVFFFHTTMPEVYTPSVSRAEYSEMPYYDGIDSFWSAWIFTKWMAFAFFTTLHLLLYILLRKNTLLLNKSDKKTTTAMPDLTGIATIKEQNMRYFTFLLLFSPCLSVFAQKKMTIRNSETGKEMTITVPDGLVITSGIEGEDGDFVVTDTLYADNGEPCIVDTVACDTVESDFLVSADGLYNLAQQYQAGGKYIEMVIALYQSWLMGSMDEVDAFISLHEDVKKALAFMIFMDNVSDKDKGNNLEYLNGLNIEGDKEICVFADVLKLRFSSMDQMVSLRVFRAESNKKYKDNPFYSYINALIEYDDDGEYKSQQQSFEQMKDVVNQGVALAYADMARKYANGSGTEKDIEKAQEYFLKTIEAGLLDKSDAVEYLSLLNENPGVEIPDELRVHLMRTVSISLPYWLNLQKRINNL